MDDKLFIMNNILQRMQKSLECTICLDLITNPLSTKCGHSFCSLCLEQLLHGMKGSATCPLCVAPITKRSLTQNKKIISLVNAVREIIDSIKEDCGYGNSPKKNEKISTLPVPIQIKEEKPEIRRGTRKREPAILHTIDSHVPVPRKKKCNEKNTSVNETTAENILNDDSSNSTPKISVSEKISHVAASSSASSACIEKPQPFTRKLIRRSLNLNSVEKLDSNPNFKMSLNEVKMEEKCQKLYCEPVEDADLSESKVVQWLNESNNINFRIGASQSQTQPMDAVPDEKPGEMKVESPSQSQCSTILFELPNDIEEIKKMTAKEIVSVANEALEHTTAQKPVDKLFKETSYTKLSTVTSKVYSHTKGMRKNHSYTEMPKLNGNKQIDECTKENKDTNNLGYLTDSSVSVGNDSDSVKIDNSNLKPEILMPPPKYKKLTRSKREKSVSLNNLSSAGSSDDVSDDFDHSNMDLNAKSNIRFASEIKSKFLEDSKNLSTVPVERKSRKSPGWSNFPNVKRDLRSKHIGLDITIKSDDKNHSKSDYKSFSSSFSQESVVIDDQTQMCKVEISNAINLMNEKAANAAKPPKARSLSKSRSVVDTKKAKSTIGTVTKKMVKSKSFCLNSVNSLESIKSSKLSEREKESKMNNRKRKNSGSSDNSKNCVLILGKDDKNCKIDVEPLPHSEIPTLAINGVKLSSKASPLKSCSDDFISLSENGSELVPPDTVLAPIFKAEYKEKSKQLPAKAGKKGLKRNRCAVNLHTDYAVDVPSLVAEPSIQTVDDMNNQMQSKMVNMTLCNKNLDPYSSIEDCPDGRGKDLITNRRIPFKLMGHLSSEKSSSTSSHVTNGCQHNIPCHVFRSLMNISHYMTSHYVANGSCYTQSSTIDSTVHPSTSSNSIMREIEKGIDKICSIDGKQIINKKFENTIDSENNQNLQSNINILGNENIRMVKNNIPNENMHSKQNFETDNISMAPANLGTIEKSNNQTFVVDKKVNDYEHDQQSEKLTESKGDEVIPETCINDNELHSKKVSPVKVEIPIVRKSSRMINVSKNNTSVSSQSNSSGSQKNLRRVNSKLINSLSKSKKFGTPRQILSALSLSKLSSELDVPPSNHLAGFGSSDEIEVDQKALNQKNTPAACNSKTSLENEKFGTYSGYTPIRKIDEEDCCFLADSVADSKSRGSTVSTSNIQTPKNNVLNSQNEKLRGRSLRNSACKEKSSNRLSAKSDDSDSDIKSTTSSISTRSLRKRFKRVRASINNQRSSSDHDFSDESDVVRIPRKKQKSARVLPLSTPDKDEKPQRLVDSEELRDMERYDANVWEYFKDSGQTGSNNELLLSESQKEIVKDNYNSDNDCIMATEEVVKNVEADLAMINSKRRIKTDTKGNEIDSSIIQMNSQMSGCSSVAPFLTGSTMALFEKCDKSISIAERLLNNTLGDEVPKPMEKVVSKLNRSNCTVEESDDGETEDLENVSHSSFFSSQSAVITTQKRNDVENEVSDLKAKINALQSKLQTKESNPKSKGKSEPNTVKKAPVSSTDLFEDGDKAESRKSLSDTESEEIFDSCDELPDLAPIKRNSPVASMNVCDKIKIFEPFTRSKPKNIICTGLSAVEIRQVQECIKDLCTSRDKFYSVWSPSVTHVIVSTNDDGVTERTLKYLYGVANRCWILSHSWIQESLNVNKLLPESEYEALDCTGDPGPYRSRTISKRLFADCKFFLVPPFDDVSEEQLQQILAMSGGVVVKSLSNLNSKSRQLSIIIVNSEEIDSEKVKGFLAKHSRVSISHNWVIECIGMCCRIAIGPYIVGEPQLKDFEASGIPMVLVDETQNLI